MLSDEYSSQSDKFIRKADIILAKRIKKKISELKTSPFMQDTKRIYDNEFPNKTFRVRVGGYRIFYGVDLEKNIIIIHKIKKRPQAYVKEELD